MIALDAASPRRSDSTSNSVARQSGAATPPYLDLVGQSCRSAPFKDGFAATVFPKPLWSRCLGSALASETNTDGGELFQRLPQAKHPSRELQQRRPLEMIVASETNE